jgi:polyisoprenoid-binding protein YceI
MKRKFKKGLALTIVSMLVFGAALEAQPIYKIMDSRGIDMKLSGTSTLHKWAMEAKTFDGEATFGFGLTNKRELTSLTALTFSLDVQNLKSDEKALDRNAYKALKSNEYKDIYYKLSSAKVLFEKENNYKIKTDGSLSIAGVTKEVTMDVYCVVNPDATIRCTGSDKLNMSDYQVKPPSFMLGAMKTGDAITLDFTLVFTK